MLYQFHLTEKYLNEDKQDISNIIRGRIYAVRDITQVPDTLDNEDVLLKELRDLEREGFTEHVTPDLRNVTPKQPSL